MDQDRRKAWGFSLFADDVRAEAGGKVSLMGLYQDDMVFHGTLALPFVVPKFVIFICYYELKEALQTDITFRVTGEEDNLLFELPLSRKDLVAPAKTRPEQESPEDAERIFHARIPIIISPFAIEKLGRIRVRAHYSDGAVLKLGSINILHIPTKEFLELAAKNFQEARSSAG